MNPLVRITLYVVLAAVLGFCGLKILRISRATGLSAGSGGPAAPGTNAAPAATNAAPSTNAAAADPSLPGPDGSVRQSSSRLGSLMGYGIAGFAALLGLSLLIGFDISKFVANRVDEFVFNDDLKGVKDPDYEEAENVWARGQHLEAVQLLRDFYKRNPSEVYAALRIAEIYETNLHNYLAAALEYEEILKRKLPAERWGWAAIHLVNLYLGKLDKAEQANALLHRIVNEYGQTAAAKKARERLGLPEPVEAEFAEVPPPAPAPPPEEPPSNLPPGFRRK
jgi:TolA-binding protein